MKFDIYTDYIFGLKHEVVNVLAGFGITLLIIIGAFIIVFLSVAIVEAIGWTIKTIQKWRGKDYDVY